MVQQSSVHPARSLADWRSQFPVLAHKTYLSSGSYAALALDVKAAFETYLDDRLTKGADWGGWVMKNEAVRAKLARLLNASADEIAVTTSASAGINALASAFNFQGARRKVVISDFEFPTNAQIWHAQSLRGAEVVHVPTAADGSIPVSHFEQCIDENTALVAITHICYRNGQRLDIPAIAKLAHERGAKILVDSYQFFGAYDVDVKALDVDFLAGGMLKYLLGTAGIGFLYVRDRLIPDLIPTTTGWFAQDNPAAMDITANRPAQSARRFEAGTPPVVNCYAAEAGLGIIEQIGIPQIERYVEALTRRGMERLKAAGFSLATPFEDNRRGPTIAIRSRAENELVERLMERNIVTSCRDGNVRASFHFYNNDDDIDALVQGLEAHRDLVVSE